jgi:predicted transposase YbfD/YdcC
MAGLIEHFASLPDPRIERCKKHNLIDIIFITITAVICGADDWEDIEEFGVIRADWLKNILELPNGIPSHDTFNRVFSLLDPIKMEECFVSWVQSVASLTEGQVISIDGKRLCASGEQGKKSIIHMVSAWSDANHLVLAQQKVSDKSNEITAIPALLEVLCLKGCIVTIDAMGCQKDIAAKIIEKQADYVLAVKGNQKHLLDDIQEAFAAGKISDSYSQVEIGHGRIEKRTCELIADTHWLCNQEQWTNVKTLIALHSQRTIKATGETQRQTRYFISSLTVSATQLGAVIREHWSIENDLHWTLDVAFGEDKSRKRAGHAAQNFSLMSKIALNLLKLHEDRRGSKKISIKTKRKKAAWEKDYLIAILNQADKL